MLSSKSTQAAGGRYLSVITGFGKAVLLLLFLAPIWIGSGQAGSAQAREICQRSPLAVTTNYLIAPGKRAERRAIRRAERRAKRRWKRRAARLYGCQYGKLSVARGEHMYCSGNTCTLTATPCKATNLICN